MKKTDTLNAIPFNTLLKRVNLGGLIEECILNVTDNIGSINAIDMGNSVLVSVSEPLSGLDKGEYGISSISTLVRFLTSCKDEDLTYSISDDKKWMHLKHKGHGRFSIVLLENDMVGTKLTDCPKIHKQLESYKVSIRLKNRFVEDALRYIGLVNCPGVKFSVKNGKVLFVSNVSNGQQKFEVPVGETKSDDFSIEIYTDQISKVLSVIELGEDSKIYLTKELPVIIAQDSKNYWALTPVVS